ncbi:MAG: ornithine cyclodeaminase family protein [Gemmatimonadetes bacterium]|uniref:Ornithine cyclodeaminase family protein n=1 Tax=Candidatus Kutchimonas denitrificans TaxID=3056748 RepID=A0AAE4Z6L0_9BACT|nr:ornithine cyclodeaminase family protein [Gemmatimonadota bacterium]NIR74299.1 ornithine cyclodeaminase family protein [Candidatus Kutchimonas denitrificans]NIS02554.1 ornithine cyclodeaminase family protein [Gemmatimonadota bacterium]NIT68430.1 ornithine cyclodeaminase family protein [Gemmatimonadota bacterium]NIU51882.1 ornithine cyclodeaminase family protein [Gemmatimonadota bacterium]
MSEMLYLSAADVAEAGPSMSEIVEALERMFVEKAKGAVEMPPKPGVHTAPDAFIHAMPAYIPAMSAAGMKWVAGYPQNRERGLPYVTGLLILNDPETGLPLAVMDATWITAMRTGAATAVAAKRLARPDASRVGIVACGVQGRSNLEALSCVLEIEKVKAYDIRPQAARDYAAEMGERLGLAVEPVNELRAAVSDLDVVVTSGPILKNPDPSIDAGWLSPGGFACALDFDSYWTGAALAEADLLATDDKNQMEYYRTVGYFAATPEPHAELAELVSGAKTGRRSAEERAICINLGLALEDMATAVLVYERAKAQDIGRWLQL